MMKTKFTIQLVEYKGKKSYGVNKKASIPCRTLMFHVEIKH
jgi:hypothetical protein